MTLLDLRILVKRARKSLHGMPKNGPSCGLIKVHIKSAETVLLDQKGKRGKTQLSSSHQEIYKILEAAVGP